MKKIFFLTTIIVLLISSYLFNLKAYENPHETFPNYKPKTEQNNETYYLKGNYDLTLQLNSYLFKDKYYRFDFPLNWPVIHLALRIEGNMNVLSRLINYETDLDNTTTRIRFRDFSSVELIEDDVYLVLTIPTSLLNGKKSPLEFRNTTIVNENQVSKKLMVQYKRLYNLLIRKDFNREYNLLIERLNNLLNIELKNIKTVQDDINLDNENILYNKRYLDELLNHKDESGFLNSYNYIKKQIKNFVSLYNKVIENVNFKFDLNLDNIDYENIIEGINNKDSNIESKISKIEDTFKSIRSLEEEKNIIINEKDNEKDILNNKILKLKKEIENINSQKIGKEKVDEIINSYEKLFIELEKIYEINIYKFDKKTNFEKYLETIKEINFKNFLELSKLIKYKNLEENYTLLIKKNDNEILKTDLIIKKYNTIILKINNLINILNENNLKNLNTLLASEDINNTYNINIEKIKENEEKLNEFFKKHYFKNKLIESSETEKNSNKINKSSDEDKKYAKTISKKFEFGLIEIITLTLLGSTFLIYLLAFIYKVIKAKKRN